MRTSTTATTRTVRLTHGARLTIGQTKCVLKWAPNVYAAAACPGRGPGPLPPSATATIHRLLSERTAGHQWHCSAASTLVGFYFIDCQAMNPRAEHSSHGSFSASFPDGSGKRTIVLGSWTHVVGP